MRSEFLSLFIPRKTQIMIMNTLSSESLFILIASWPYMIAFLLEFSIEFITIGFCGSLGQRGKINSLFKHFSLRNTNFRIFCYCLIELSSAVMGFMFCNLTGFSIGYGINTALDKIAPESNAKSKALVKTSMSPPSFKRKPSIQVSLLDIALQRGILFALIST